MKNGPITALVNGNEIELKLENGVLTANGRPLETSIVHVGGSTYSLLLNGKSFEITLEQNGLRTQVTESAIRSEVVVVDRASLLMAAIQGSKGSKRHALEIHAPMPGLVLAVEVDEGSSVTAGQGILVLEAMKMENQIFSIGAGIVERVHVTRGDTVTKGQLLVTLVAE